MKRFTTSRVGDGGEIVTGHVVAQNLDHAQAICDARGRGEVVEGETAQIQRDDRLTRMTPQQMLKALQDEPDATLDDEDTSG